MGRLSTHRFNVNKQIRKMYIEIANLHAEDPTYKREALFTSTEHILSYALWDPVIHWETIVILFSLK